MGAGNELLTGWSKLDYQPKTFFIDIAASDAEVLMEQIDLINDESIERSEDDIRIDLDNENWNLFCKQTFQEIVKELKIPSTFDMLDATNVSELSAAFRGSATILEATENVLIVTCGGEMMSHVSFGFVPNFKYERISEEVYEDNWQKEDMFNRKKTIQTFDEYLKLKTIDKYQNKINRYISEVRRIMQILMRQNKGKISIRTSSWSSENIKSYNVFKKLMEN